MVAMIIENLGARAARACWPHLPEIVGCGDADDPILRHAHLFPNLKRLVIGMIDRGQKTFRVDIKILGDQFPCKGNGLFFKVITKREIPKHFEKRVMARRVADIIKVIMLAARAHTFLRRGGAWRVTMLKPCEDVFELHHARIGEHQSRVIARHKRRAFDNGMAVAFKIFEKG